MNGVAPRSSGLLQLALIALVFIVPIGLAAWLYYGDSDLVPAGRTNHGALLDPIVNLHDALPNSAVADLSEDHWLLVYANDGVCDRACAEALYTLRQSRLMLGNDMSRVRRVFLHGQFPPDTVLVEDEHPGLIIISDEELGDLLAEQRPREMPADGYFLVDPLGNLVMYFPPDIVPGEMVEDMKQLLDLSRIG